MCVRYEKSKILTFKILKTNKDFTTSADSVQMFIVFLSCAETQRCLFMDAGEMQQLLGDVDEDFDHQTNHCTLT